MSFQNLLFIFFFFVWHKFVDKKNTNLFFGLYKIIFFVILYILQCIHSPVSYLFSWNCFFWLLFLFSFVCVCVWLFLLLFKWFDAIAIYFSLLLVGLLNSLTYPEIFRLLHVTHQGMSRKIYNESYSSLLRLNMKFIVKGDGCELLKLFLLKLDFSDFGISHPLLDV